MILLPQLLRVLGLQTSTTVPSVNWFLIKLLEHTKGKDSLFSITVLRKQYLHAEEEN